MKVSFLGAAQTVTGSCYMINANGVRFGIDCGMHQGNRDIERRNRDTELYVKEKIDFFLLTHAHIDHSGLLPRIVREGFDGPVYCTSPTQELVRLMLLDSAHIQEMEAEWELRKQKRKGDKNKIEPLYTQADAIKAGNMLQIVEYNTPFEPAPGIRVTYRDAGHILGSAFVELEITETSGVTHLLFSGDLGRYNALFMNDPAIPNLKLDYLFMETTYGDRDHKSEGKSLEELAEAIAYSYKLGGKVVIPAFAVERTQEVIYCLYLLRKENKLPEDMPVFVDSPLAIQATEIFRHNPRFFDQETQEIFAKGDDPLKLPNMYYTQSKEESMAINDHQGPAIIISASGMCNAGRIKHHLRHNIWDPKSSIVFVGYQAVGTPGRKIVDGAQQIRILNEDVAIAAKIFTIGGFSGHAGQSQMLQWISRFTHPELNILLIHGEPKAQEVFAELLRSKFKLKVSIPNYLEELTLAPGKEPMVQQDTQRAKPHVNWEILLSDSENKMTSIRSRVNKINDLPWEEQVELRDSLLEINSALLNFMTRI